MARLEYREYYWSLLVYPLLHTFGPMEEWLRIEILIPTVDHFL